MAITGFPDPNELLDKWAELLLKARAVKLDSRPTTEQDTHPLVLLASLGQALRDTGHPREGQVTAHVYEIALADPSHGGLGLSLDSPLHDDSLHEISFLLSAWLESLNSDDRQKSTGPRVQKEAPASRPPMNITEKIFAVHDVQSKGYVQAGETIRVSLDWIMASEASWGSMETTYDHLGKPGIFRNDRFWLAGDHVVDPRVKNVPVIKRLVDASERARKVFKMTEYQGMNYTIMHTEFFRERAQPGMLIIGSDSHTCSSGALGCLAIGLGAADVTMGLVTGQTWFKVPEVVNIVLTGKPRRGAGGKDVILYILQQLKRNTVAADRIVEYTGPGVAYLSADARFAIANMTTEFGGVTGIFAPDKVTKAFVDGRKTSRNKNAALYFRPDADAVYAESHTIDLGNVTSFVAKYPNPDDVVSVTEASGLALDGCFIGACTTAEEDILLGALVLEQGLKSGLKPVTAGKKRKVVPGSRPILERLQTLGLKQVYEEAGFEVGIPGCSYCVGMSADKAGQGEVWLSSQNRNFENRMGQGSIGNLASAATVAASSFSMTVTDPQPLIDQIPVDRWESVKGRGSLHEAPQAHEDKEPEWVEPANAAEAEAPSSDTVAGEQAGAESLQEAEAKTATPEKRQQHKKPRRVQGKIQRLGHFVDTDALAPAQFLISARTNEELGSHCLEFTNPSFRGRVQDGFDVVVAGKAFGCGSSREQAVSALLGCGIKCVIAESFAFIYGRNQPSLGLLGFSIDNPAFFAVATDGASIDIDLETGRIRIGDDEFPFQLSTMETELVELGGITPAFMKFGNQLFNMLCGATGPRGGGGDANGPAKEMQW